MSDSHHNPQQSFNSESLDSKISRLLTLQETDHESRIIFRKEITKQLEVVAERIDMQGEKLNKTSQSTEFLIKDSEGVAIKLDLIGSKVDFTNGKVAAAIRDIFALQEKIKKQEAIESEINEILMINNFIKKWLLNRYFLVFISIFIIGLVKVINNPEIREHFIKALGLG